MIDRCLHVSFNHHQEIVDSIVSVGYEFILDILLTSFIVLDSEEFELKVCFNLINLCYFKILLLSLAKWGFDLQNLREGYSFLLQRGKSSCRNVFRTTVLVVFFQGGWILSNHSYIQSPFAPVAGFLTFCWHFEIFFTPT